jgi:hypothetical protein
VTRKQALGWLVSLLTVAVLLLVCIPCILKAVRLANERNAIGSLQQLGVIETAFRSTDGDGNGVLDYWTADVAGLYYISPAGTGS